MGRPAIPWHTRWLHVGGCLEWTGPLDKDGYGHAYYEGKCEQAHRAQWKRERGAIPAGVKVLHTCDNRKCGLLDHLYLGTQKKNIDDMVQRGRSTRGHSMNGGRKHWNYKHGLYIGRNRRVA
jgi:hypothetical protein